MGLYIQKAKSLLSCPGPFTRIITPLSVVFPVGIKIPISVQFQATMAPLKIISLKHNRKV